MLLEKVPNAEEYAESVLSDLEDLEIEQLYKDANTSGAAKLNANGDIKPAKGAWIA